MSETVPKTKGTYATGRRKSAVAKVYIFPASNHEKELFLINSIPASEYFGSIVELLKSSLFPLTITGNSSKYKVVCSVIGGGKHAQSDAISLGIAKALLSLDNGLRIVLKQYDLLTRDNREVERKKPGLRKARKAEQFSKR